MSFAAPTMDRVDRDQPLSLRREVLPPREALCDTCLAAGKYRVAIGRALWVSAVITALAHLLERWPW